MVKQGSGGYGFTCRNLCVTREAELAETPERDTFDASDRLDNGTIIASQSTSLEDSAEQEVFLSPKKRPVS